MTTYSYTLTVNDSEYIALSEAINHMIEHCELEMVKDQEQSPKPYRTWLTHLNKVKSRLHENAKQTSGTYFPDDFRLMTVEVENAYRSTQYVVKLPDETVDEIVLINGKFSSQVKELMTRHRVRDAVFFPWNISHSNFTPEQNDYFNQSFGEEIMKQAACVFSAYGVCAGNQWLGESYFALGIPAYAAENLCFPAGLRVYVYVPATGIPELKFLPGVIPDTK